MKYDDLCASPETLIGETVEGELLASPRPSTGQSNVAGGLTDELRGPFRRGSGGPGGWWLLYEPEMHLRADVLVPDPVARTLEVFRRSTEAQWILVGNFAGNQTARIEPFDAVEIDLSALWLEDVRG